MSSKPRRNITLRLVLFLAIAGTVSRCLFVLVENPLDHLFSDPQRHWDNASRFWQPTLMSGCDPILYQLYLFCVQTVTAGNKIAIGVITAALSGVMPWIYYRAGRELGLDKLTGLIFWALMAWLPSFFVIYSYFMIETLLLPLIGAGLWATGRAIRKNDLPSFLGMTLFWTLACLTKPQSIIIAAICLGYVFWKTPGKIAAACASAAIITLLLIPNAIRSRQILGYAAPLGSGYIAQIMHASGKKHSRFHWDGEILGYSSPSCGVRPFEPFHNWLVVRGRNEDVCIIRAEKKNAASDWKAALENQHPSLQQTTINWRDNVILFLLAPSWPDSPTNTIHGVINHISRWMWLPVIGFLLFQNAAIFLRRNFPFVPVLTTAACLILMLQNSVTMEGRYRKPIEPLLLLNLLWLTSSSVGGCYPNRGPGKEESLMSR